MELRLKKMVIKLVSWLVLKDSTNPTQLYNWKFPNFSQLFPTTNLREKI